MKLSTAINKASIVFATVHIANNGCSIQVSKANARRAVDEFLPYEMNEDGYFTYDYYGTIAWYDESNNELYLG
jgi:hypothetical protein